MKFDRRQLLAGGGLLVAFSMTGRSMAQLSGGGEGGGAPAPKRPDLPGSLKSNPILESWVHIAPDGGITVFSGGDAARLGAPDVRLGTVLGGDVLPLPQDRGGA